MKLPFGWTTSIRARDWLAIGTYVVSASVQASTVAGAGEPTGHGTEALQASTFAESPMGDSVWLVGIALLGVVTISRRHKTP